MTSVMEAFVTMLTAYAAVGLGFAVLFVTVGVHRLDHQAEGAGAGFRLIILPGVAALWPLLLARWLRGVAPPVERNAHRRQTTQGGPS